jgi:myosin heavy subunit
MLHLDRDATSYAYLNKSGCSKLAAIDDKQQFNVTIVSIFTVQGADCMPIDASTLR